MEQNTSNTGHLFVSTPLNMLMSQAYRKLSPSAAKALPLFLMKVPYSFYREPERYYEKVFKFPYSEARRLYGIGTRTFYNAIQQLKRYGFIEQTRKGGFSGDQRFESEYRLSDKWKGFKADSKPESFGKNIGQNCQPHI